MLRECPYTADRRDVLENTFPRPERFPEAISRAGYKKICFGEVPTTGNSSSKILATLLTHRFKYQV